MSTRTAARVRRQVDPDRWVDRLSTAVRIVGFWLAVTLPLAYVPIVAFSTVPTHDPWMLIGAVAVNLLAIAVGHEHEPALDRWRGGV